MFHFYIEMPNWAEVLSLILTGIGLSIGIIALFIWKMEKQWEIIMEAKANAKKNKRFLEYKYSSMRDISSMLAQEKIPEPVNEKDLIIDLLQEVENAKHLFSGTADSLRLTNEKLMFAFKKKNRPIIEFYNKLCSLLDEHDRLKDSEIRTNLQLYYHNNRGSMLSKESYNKLMSNQRKLRNEMRELKADDQVYLSNALIEIMNYKPRTIAYFFHIF